MNPTVTSNPQGIKVEINQSRVRQAPNTSFGSVLKTGLERTGNAVVSAAGVASAYIPGGHVVSAAISGASSVKSSLQAQSGAALQASGANSTGLVTATGGGVAAGGFAGSGDALAQIRAGDNSPGTLMLATQQMAEMNQSFNLQYLMLQQQMQAENRRFTVLSQVMKAKHDTARSAIQNIK